MFASELLAIGLAVISVGFRPIDGFDLNKAQEDDRWRHIRRTPEADSFAEPQPSTSRQHWDDDDNQDLRDVFEQLFPETSGVRHRNSNPPPRPSWDSPDDDDEDNVDENGDDTNRIRKRYYVPSVSCDSTSLGHGTGPYSHHGSSIPKLMRLPRRILHRRSVDEKEASRRRRSDKGDDDKGQHRVTADDNTLQGNDVHKSQDFFEPTDDSAERDHTRQRGSDEDDDDKVYTDDRQEPEQTGLDRPTKQNMEVRNAKDDRHEQTGIDSSVPARASHLSLSDMLDLQRKLRYEGIHQMASDRREESPGQERERGKLTSPRPTRLPEDAI